MGFFENFFSVVLLVLSIVSCYQLIRHRPDLFSGSNLSRAFTTMGFIALGLAGFVALLFYSLPHGPSGISQPAESRSAGPAERSKSYDRSL